MYIFLFYLFCRKIDKYFNQLPMDVFFRTPIGTIVKIVKLNFTIRTNNQLY